MVMMVKLIMMTVVLIRLDGNLKVENKGVRQPINLNLWDTAGQVGQSGIKCIIVASAMRAEQGPCEPSKGCIREIREQ